VLAEVRLQIRDADLPHDLIMVMTSHIVKPARIPPVSGASAASGGRARTPSQSPPLRRLRPADCRPASGTWSEARTNAGGTPMAPGWRVRDVVILNAPLVEARHCTDRAPPLPAA
jgi:hypothetical protein